MVINGDWWGLLMANSELMVITRLPSGNDSQFANLNMAQSK